MTILGEYCPCRVVCSCLKIHRKWSWVESEQHGRFEFSE